MRCSQSADTTHASRFTWHEMDAKPWLHPSWQHDIISVCTNHMRHRLLTAASVTSRELRPTDQIPTAGVNGHIIKAHLPWLYDLYRGPFLQAASKFFRCTAVCAVNDLYAINLNVQQGPRMRYECHVDSNPIEGLLYVTTNPQETGGELVVSHNEHALGPHEISKDCARIRPVAGKMLFFDARRFPHYVTALKHSAAVRIVVAMNYYTPTCTEADRPADLNRHLYGVGC